jgi:two-component system nitrogen regulation response regulator NtrX
LIGASAAIGSVRAAIERVAPTGSRVFITGPAGAGKEVVARLIHERSRRSSGPFVVVNAAMMRPDSLELELFGSGSGDDEWGEGRKIGTFERAHGGTLYFDEVADMPLETQGKIVRVLQEQTFERVGGGKRIQVDVRVMAATNRDLSREIALGRFREDLFYRLNVVPIPVPALAERRGDIPELAHYFMVRAAATSGLTPRLIGDDAMAVLQSRAWPGNVRQLRNVIEWLLIMASDDSAEPVGAGMLPPDLNEGAAAATRFEEDGKIMTLPLRDAREIFEREYLTAQLNRFGGNVSRTAQFVGMERSALHRKLKSLSITEENLSRERNAASGASA